jgi:hypothetical protein
MQVDWQSSCTSKPLQGKSNYSILISYWHTNQPYDCHIVSNSWTTGFKFKNNLMHWSICRIGHKAVKKKCSTGQKHPHTALGNGHIQSTSWGNWVLFSLTRMHNSCQPPCWLFLENPQSLFVSASQITHPTFSCKVSFWHELQNMVHSGFEDKPCNFSSTPQKQHGTTVSNALS